MLRYEDNKCLVFMFENIIFSDLLSSFITKK